MNEKSIEHTIAIQDDIVASNVEKIKENIKTIIGNEHKKIFITVDLSGINMVDSSGIGLLIAVQNTLLRDGGSLKIKNASSNIKQLLKMMRIDKHLQITE